MSYKATEEIKEIDIDYGHVYVAGDTSLLRRVKRINDHIRARLEPQEQRILPPPDEFERQQWDDEFERLMRNRMVAGAYRYGLIRDPDNPRRDQIQSIIDRCELYRETGNTEYLVDIANLALVEWVKGDCHPSPRFWTVDDGYHTEEI